MPGVLQGHYIPAISSVLFDSSEERFELVVDGLAKLASIILLADAKRDDVFSLESVDGVKLKKPVMPGDRLVMEVEMKNWNKRTGMAVVTGTASVDGEIVAFIDQLVFAMHDCERYEIFQFCICYLLLYPRVDCL